MTIFTVFFFAVLVANFEFAGFAPRQNTRVDCFHGNGLYCKILAGKEPIRAQGLHVCHKIIDFIIQLHYVQYK